MLSALLVVSWILIFALAWTYPIAWRTKREIEGLRRELKNERDTVTHLSEAIQKSRSNFEAMRKTCLTQAAEYTDLESRAKQETALRESLSEERNQLHLQCEGLKHAIQSRDGIIRDLRGHIEVFEPRLSAARVALTNYEALCKQHAC